MAYAIRVHKTGGPEALQYEQVEVGAPGQGQVKLKQHAIGLNYIDVYFRTGAYPAATNPFTPGNEGAGVITAIGAGVAGFKVGDRVKRADGISGVVTHTEFKRQPNEPRQVEVKWDRSGSQSVRPEAGLELA